MINAKLEINGKTEEVLFFDNMFEYVNYFGSDISHYTIGSDSNKEFIVDEENFSDDSDLIFKDGIEFQGDEYTRINWGEPDISFIKDSGINQTLYSIYQKTGNGEYQNYKSLIFETEEEAQKKADELNQEE